jgi:hypothetical protein
MDEKIALHGLTYWSVSLLSFVDPENSNFFVQARSKVCPCVWKGTAGREYCCGHQTL